MGIIERNLFANICANIIIVLLVLIATPIYVNILGIEKYSLIGIYFTLITILGIIDTGITAVISREIAYLTSKSKKNNLIGSTFYTFEILYWLILISVGILLIFLSIIFWNIFINSNLERQEVSISIILIILTIIIQLPSNYYIGALMGLQKQVLASQINVFFHTLRIISSLILILFTQDLRLFFSTLIIVSLLQTFTSRYIAWQKLKKYSDEIIFSFKVLHNIKNFALSIIIITGLSVVTSNIDKFYVSKNFNLEILGYYLLCWSIASGLFRLGIPIMQTFSPHFAELFSLNNYKALSEKYLLSNKLIFLFIIPISITIIMNSELVIYSWTQNVYVASNSVNILQFLVMGSMFSICAYPALSLLYSQKKYKKVLIFHIFGFIVSILYYNIFLNDNLYISYYYVAFYGFIFMLFSHWCSKFINQNINIIKSFFITIFVSVIINFAGNFLFISEKYILNILILLLILIFISIIIIIINKEFKKMIKQFIINFKN